MGILHLVCVLRRSYGSTLAAGLWGRKGHGIFCGRYGGQGCPFCTMLVQSNLAPLHQLFTGGAQGYVGGTNDAGVVAERGDLDGRLARGGKRVALEVLANLIEVDIGRGGGAAADQEHLGIDHVGDKRQSATEIIGHGIGRGQRELVTLAAGLEHILGIGGASELDGLDAFSHSAR